MNPQATPDPTWDPSDEYEQADRLLPKLSEDELAALVGAITAEFVNRGNDHETALEAVQDAAHGGIEGSRLFDQMED